MLAAQSAFFCLMLMFLSIMAINHLSHEAALSFKIFKGIIVIFDEDSQPWKEI